MPDLIFTILVFAAGGLSGVLLMAIVSITRPDPNPDNVRIVIIRSAQPQEESTDAQL